MGSVKICMSDGTEIDDDEILKNCADGTILHFVCESAEQESIPSCSKETFTSSS